MICSDVLTTCNAISMAITFGFGLFIGYMDRGDKN